MGGSLALTLFYPFFGLIIAVLKWEWVYHTCGIAGIIWYICWEYFVYDTPAQHPRIDVQERAYIQTALGNMGIFNYKVF